MAKKRKLHSSEPKSTRIVDAPPEQQQEEEENADEHQQEPFKEQRREHRQPKNAGEDNSAAAVAEYGNKNEDEDDNEPVEKLLEPFTKEQLHSLVKQAVKKHPDLVDSIRHLADAHPDHRKIFVHGLGWHTTAETITRVFGKYGEIEDCNTVTHKDSGKSKGYAFILFKHRSGALGALKQPQKKIGNRTIFCQLASTGPVPAPPGPVSDHIQRKIFVRNVNAEIDPQRLLEFFKLFGEVEHGPLGLDKHTGKPKGFAVFVYKSVESAKKALEEPYKNFEGHTLYCEKGIDVSKRNRGYHHQQPHHHQQQQQHHSHHHDQPSYRSRNEKNEYSSGGAPPYGNTIAPSAPIVGFNPGVPVQPLNPVLGQAFNPVCGQALNPAPGLGHGNLFLGGAPVNQAGPPSGYGNQDAVRYGNQPGVQPGYPNPQVGQSSGVWPYLGAGSSYMGQ